MNIKDIRRENMRFLVKVAGSITAMAKRLDKSPSQISQLIGAKKSGSKNKPIGDMIAAQVEAAFNKPRGWLDKEHFHIRETFPDYVLMPVVHFVPLITWNEIQTWQRLADTNEPKTYTQWLPVSNVHSKKAFALQVNGDSMEAPSGTSFPNGALIVVDPDKTPTNKSYVVVNLNEKENNSTTFKQLIIDGNRRYLKPLNPRYPILELSDNAVIIGIIKQMVLEFD